MAERGRIPTEVEAKRIQHAVQVVEANAPFVPAARKDKRNRIPVDLNYAIGKTDGAISANSTGTVSLYKDIQSSPADTGVNRTCYAFTAIDADLYVSVLWYNDGFYCFPLECNA